MSLQNSRVLVVGGTSGIGLAIAKAVADRGATAIVAARRQAGVDAALAELPSTAEGWTVDLTDPASLASLAERVGSIDHLAFTAGETLELAPLADLEPQAIESFYATRLFGALTVVRVFAPRIAEGGSITLTSGTAAHTPAFGVLPVSICGAMNAATTALAVELAPIRVNAVAPGIVRTPLWDAMDEAGRRAMFEDAAQRLPLGRIGEPEDAALAYVYCMEQSYGTGIVLTVDGGTLLT